MNKEKILKQISQKLITGSMSAFIGAGFSKNGSDNYPLWDELLEGSDDNSRNVGKDLRYRRDGTGEEQKH